MGIHRRLVLPLAFAAGQGVWLVAIAVIVLIFGGDVGSVLLDVCADLVAVSVLVVMLVRHPLRPWFYALVAYEILSIVLNVGSLIGMSGSVVVPMLIHLSTRITVALSTSTRSGRATDRWPAGTTPKSCIGGPQRCPPRVPEETPDKRCLVHNADFYWRSLRKRGNSEISKA